MSNEDYNLLSIKYNENNISNYIKKYTYIKEKITITVFNDIALDIERALDNAFLNKKERTLIEMIMNGNTKDEITYVLGIADRTYYKYNKSAIKKITTFLQD